MLNHQQIKLFSSRQTDHWATPRWLYNRLNAEFYFDLDPCPLHAQFDGLGIPRFGNVFVNPPNSRATEFLAKAHDELAAGTARTAGFRMVVVFRNHRFLPDATAEQTGT
jgi:hypothetical protein